MNDPLIAYLSGLTVSQGRLAGERFRVLPWEARFVRRAFRPGVQSAGLSIARGNGKTALLSGIACATLDGPLAVSRGETVIVASSFEQARIAFEHVIAFMATSSGTAPRGRSGTPRNKRTHRTSRDRRYGCGASVPTPGGLMGSALCSCSRARPCARARG